MERLVVSPAAPYSLERTVGSFARFPDESVDIVIPGGYRRLFDVDGDLLLSEASQSPGDRFDAPVEVRTLNQEPPESNRVDHALRMMQRVVAIEEPVDELYRLLGNHPTLRVLLDHLTGLRRTLDPTPFEGLVSSILAQLISIRGAAVVRARLVQRFGRRLEFDGRSYWSFPEPESLVDSSVDELCSLKMTSAKARSILAVANAAVAGELERNQLERHTDAELIRHLTALPGIGPWTAEWFLVNVLGRMSIVPAGDLGIRRSTGNWLRGGEMPSPDEVRETYEPYGDFRAYVAYYVLSAERFQLSPQT